MRVGIFYLFQVFSQKEYAQRDLKHFFYKQDIVQFSNYRLKFSSINLLGLAEFQSFQFQLNPFLISCFQGKGLHTFFFMPYISSVYHNLLSLLCCFPANLQEKIIWNLWRFLGKTLPWIIWFFFQFKDAMLFAIYVQFVH